ncbi:unnamed protein product [Coffea canephora]|uniref:DH200=94 genomic scaffold, scaffold_133 n=1 Tax=Coffea canephora TaxID=49390 RepID=A0A068V7R6_COFCA|nr:unnamed protein product [Coffea canephora]
MLLLHEGWVGTIWMDCLVVQLFEHLRFSLSQLWILGGSFSQDVNRIEAGWQVSPDLYGDNNTRLLTY